MDRTELALCVDVLGPLSLRVHGQVVEVPGLRRRALLALLALSEGRTVSTDRLVDSLWPHDPPEVQALYNQVSRLRAHLGPLADRLTRSDGGYRLSLEPFELDVDAVRRTGDPTVALALWRGRSLDELRGFPALEVASVGLEELRKQLVDDALAARLAAGEQVAVDAAAAAAAAPLRESTLLLHVRALAADGRSAEAMSAAAEFRRRLADETGLDPTPALAQLEQQVAAGSVERPSAVRKVARPDGPMVGRRHDREEVLRLLGGHAAVTVTGPGGVGKTRLALDIAADVAEAVVVSLAVVERASRVSQAVASTLGLRTSGTVSPNDIAAALADRSLLLVLDNCEHVVDACRELVVAVRRAAPDVRVLATSRVTLQVPGEYVLRLQPLPVPGEVSDFEALRRQPGVRAFVEHARRRTPSYDLAVDDAADLVEVLRRLDGLPLGIELAARQVGLMPLREVLARLDRALDLATGKAGSQDQRQRTLRATIESSYRLLTEDEQWLLRAIAPFAGGVDLATVEVLGALLDGDPLDLLHRLVDSSLIVADASSGRYHQLFTVRAFLFDEIVRLGEGDEANKRFVARCRVVAEEIGARMVGPDEASFDRRLRAELANFRAARDLGTLEDRAAITVTLEAVVVWRDLREIWDWACELVGELPSDPAVVAAAAEAARLIGDFDAATRHAEAAIAMGDSGKAWSVLGVVAHFRGDFTAARELWLRAGDTCPMVGSAALASAYEGSFELARSLLERARSRVECGTDRAFVAYVEGELRPPEEAIACYVDAIAEASAVGCSFVEGVARVSLASARARTGDVPGAASGFAYLIEFWRRTGQATQLWTTARNAAELLASVGSVETAALLLVCADQAPGAAAVGPEIARFSGRAFVPVTELVTEVGPVQRQVAKLGASGVLDRAVQELTDLSA